MKIFYFFVILGGVCSMSLWSAPNVIVIYSDDHGWADLAVQGVDTDVRTPNLDQLARDGVRFSRGYVSAPQCVPSRAGLITGTHQNRFGVEDNTKGPLPLDVVTLPERLKKAGYVTGMCGKWHLDLGEKKDKGRTMRLLPDHMPQGHGFDEYWRGEMRQYYASHDLHGKPFADAPHLVSDNRFRITVQTEAALSFLERRALQPEVPWFLYLAWYAPHVPLESPEPWFSRTPEHLPKERRQALAMIAAMDEGLATVRERIKTMGMEKNTLIFFIGDNGAPLKTGAWNGSINSPLVGEKGMLTDGGVRVPFLAAWPSMIPAGQVYDQPVMNLDVAATAVALAGLPHDDGLDGVNLMPFLLGEKMEAPHDSLYWRWRSQAAVLEFPWKLIRLGEKQEFLFDLRPIDGEKQNVLAKHPDIAARLRGKLDGWSKTLKRPGKADPLNDQDNEFFARHVEASLATAGSRRPKEPGMVQGWLCRNGRLEEREGCVAILPDQSATVRGRVFITQTGLSMTGPVKVIMRILARKGGTASVSWRTKDGVDFLPENEVSFDWPTTAEWQDVRVDLPINGKLIHLRISPGRDSEGSEIQSITLDGAGQAEQQWQFGLQP